MKRFISFVLAVVLTAVMAYSVAALNGEWSYIGGGNSGGNNQGSNNQGNNNQGNNNQGSYYPNIPTWIYNNPDVDDVLVTDDGDEDDVYADDDDDSTDEVTADDDESSSSDSIMVDDPIEAIVTDCE